jgi:hypothetical protein
LRKNHIKSGTPSLGHIDLAQARGFIGQKAAHRRILESAGFQKLTDCPALRASHQGWASGESLRDDI